MDLTPPENRDERRGEERERVQQRLMTAVTARGGDQSSPPR